MPVHEGHTSMGPAPAPVNRVGRNLRSRTIARTGQLESWPG